MKKVLITGVSSGIGKALAEYFLKQGAMVFGLSRRNPGIVSERFSFEACDLGNFQDIPGSVTQLLNQHTRLDYVILNAGVLGEIEPINKSDPAAIKKVMDINVWANKVLIDHLMTGGIAIEQLVAVSSGAAVNGSRGWGAYSLSKAALNMLIKLYAGELEKTHLCALAPGLVETPMLNHILKEVDPEAYPSVARLQSSPRMRADASAELLYKTLPKLLEYESGSFVDVRNL